MRSPSFCAPVTRIVPCGWVYFAALVSRFESTCARRSGSPFTRNSSGTSSSELVAAFVDERPRRLDRRAHDRLQVGLLLAQLQRAVRDARHVEQIVEQQRHVLHLALDHVVGPALLRVGGVFVARDGRGLPDRRQRIAQLMRKRREELVLATVGLDEMALLQLALRDVGEPDREIPIERRGDDVVPGLVAVGLGLPLDVAYFVFLQRLDVQLEARAIVPGARQGLGHRASDEFRRLAAHDVRRGRVEEHPAEIDDLAGRVADRARTSRRERPRTDSTDSKRRSRWLTRSSARARSMNTAALRAQMSAMPDFALARLARHVEVHRQRAQHLAVAAHQRRGMHRAHAFGARQLAKRREPRIALACRR